MISLEGPSILFIGLVLKESKIIPAYVLFLERLRGFCFLFSFRHQVLFCLFSLETS